MLNAEKARIKPDKVFDRSNALYVKMVPRKGRGVFANVRFKAGAIIDRSPSWAFDDAAAKLIDSTGVLEYYFVRQDRYLQGDPRTGYVVFGWSSLMNHSSNPTARKVLTDEESGAWLSIIAINDIEVDEEITHCYINMSAYPPHINFID